MCYFLRLVWLKWLPVWQRRQLLVWMIFLLGTVLLLLSNSFNMENSYDTVRPLYSIQYEARRLLKYITRQHYHCHHRLFTRQLNSSWWSVCGDDKALYERNGKKIGYTVGTSSDYKLETLLAQNYSFHMYAITPQLQGLAADSRASMIHIPLAIVSNDPADVMRNSFTHRTINDVMRELFHKRLRLLRILNVEDDSQLYEVLEFLIKDNILSEVNELHLVIHFDKLDEDALFRWYRVLHSLFHTQGMRLYNAAANDPLCMEVTVFESCSYALSFIHNLGPTSFVLYPPANDGMNDMEYERFLDLVSMYKACHSTVCQTLMQDIDSLTRSVPDSSSQSPCLLRVSTAKSKLSLFNWSKGLWDAVDWLGVSYAIGNLSGDASVLSIDIAHADLNILTRAMNSNFLRNVTWVRLNAASSAPLSQGQSQQSSIFRLWYSELRRLQSHGFLLVASQVANLKDFGAGDADFRLLYRRKQTA